MDLPVGMPIKEGMDTDNADFRKLLPALRQNTLTGYMAINVMTNNGIEEGTLLFDNGQAAAAEYTYVSQSQVVKGTDALVLFMNACTGSGRFDIYELTPEEAADSLAKNKDAAFRNKPTDNDLLGLLPEKFTEKALTQAAQMIKPEAAAKTGGVSRDDLLKKYNITHPDEKALERLLGNIIDESI